MNESMDSKENRVKKIEQVMQRSPRKKEAEDAWIVNDKLGIYGVLDGSTPMDDFHDESGHNGAYLAAHLFKNYFESLETSAALHEEVARANRLLKSEMGKYHIDFSKKHHLWCTCVSLVQVTDDTLTYASLGDTMIVACDRQDRANVLTVDTVKNISYRARMQREIDRKKGIKVPPEKEVSDLIYNRSMANIPNGYSVANGMAEVPAYIQYGMIDTKHLKHLLLMSDGLFDPKGDLNTVYQKVMAEGLTSYVERLTTHEQEQGLYADDKTALLLYL